ncbi:Predicted dehydrogenase [Nocardioides terrae]|uniref:Predicted dehydrogenase n=1 Tax=Nocardioides terrae TaxID=574651 RepID=A0A1I1EB71_9ACTN|nr:Gfo/Idh/MocA family oxidoreductase [Nocardioides terrae]SFB84365.1 Predicted dehydrogenase [Nocardioides terrae]
MTTEPVRWGILATGAIAHAFARDLVATPGAELVAVGSRTAESAAAFAQEYAGHGPLPRAHGSYEELVGDPDVEVVYVATPHALHLDNARLALEAGKHVLCEKPLTLSTGDAETLIALAAERGLLLMEAMWTATHPLVRCLLAGMREGRFGTPRQVHADLGSRVDADPTSRMFDPALGAGALLDMGIYPLTFAHLVLGRAERLVATGDVRPGAGGSFDMDVAIAGRYPAGAVAALTASMSSWSPGTATVATDLGRIDVDVVFRPTRITFTPHGGDPVKLDGVEPLIGQGYGNEALEAGRCVRAGLLESPLVPHAQTLTVLGQMDEIRRQLGVVYPA